ncbi:hypothetical protein KORDIASMS9_04029 [Kordia sp. SMS9]|uniref:hypothetical protein n=1 Tax=Kordia sp. SMS9 TaxID=2282170 RepID=UPI000E0D9028|nr:hypothetical protein [Kordia sp. SMS9]AXG71771.1 hypothetical protein KORDIASMS9_04029 [Kordia sp. SMS9]
MKRTTFTALGLAALTVIACNTATKENKVEAVKTLQPIENIVEETTTQFEEKAMEDCIAYAKMQDEIKLMEAAAAQREADSIATVELELKKALEKAVAAKKKRESSPAYLAQKAAEAEAWFKANYEGVVKAYDSNYEGLRVKLNTEGNIYEVALFVNGEWIKDQNLMKQLEKVEVTHEFEPGKAVAITVKNA